jgi:hypothetical protein
MFEDGHLLAGEYCERGKKLRWSRVEGAALGEPHPWRSPEAGHDVAVDYHDRKEDATSAASKIQQMERRSTAPCMRTWRRTPRSRSCGLSSATSDQATF